MKKIVSIINPLERSPALDVTSETILMPRYGTVSVATRIRDAGYETRLFCEMSGSVIDWDYVAHSDYVCFSLMSFCSHRGYELMKRVRQVTRAPIICGGCHVSVLADECLEHCDYTVRYEGEAAVVELLAALDQGKSPEDVDGISFRRNGRVIHRPDHEFISDLNWPADFTLIAGYRPRSLLEQIWGTVRHRPSLHVPVFQTTRGCPRRCEFCFAHRELGGRYRKRHIEAVIDEVSGLVELFGRNRRMMVIDNDFCVDKRFTTELLSRLESKAGPLNLMIFTRIDTAKDEAFVRELGSHGVKVVMIGIESLSDATLKLFNKGQTNQVITDYIDVFRRHGIEVTGFFMFGADTDPSDIVSRSIAFAIEHDFYDVCLFSVYAFPRQRERMGMPQLIPDHRLIHHDWRFFNSNFVIHYPANVRPSSLQMEIVMGYERFFSKRRTAWRMLRRREPDRFFLRLKNQGRVLAMRNYVGVLKALEQDFYDGEDRLLEGRLRERPPERPRRLPL